MVATASSFPLGSAAPTVVASDANLNVLQKLGLRAAIAFIFFTNSRILDVTLPHLKIPFLLGIAALIGLIGSGNLLSAAKTRVGSLYIILTLLFIAGLPFSYFKMGHLGTLIDIRPRTSAGWVRCMFAWIIIVGLTLTYKETKMMLNACAYAVIAGAMMSAILGNFVHGRLSLEIGSFGNANDLAQALVTGIPLVWLAYYNGGKPGMVRKLFFGAALVFLCIQAGKTGSRAGLIMFGAIVALSLLRVPIRTKLQIVVAASFLLCGAFVFMPPELKLRYATVAGDEMDTDDQAGAEMEESAILSRQNRLTLLKESLQVTLGHPLFGVGLNNFPIFIYDSNKAAGRPQEPWHGTHNTFTQLSAEAGIPAALVFIVLLVKSWRMLGKLMRATKNDKRPEVHDIYCTAAALQVLLGAFCCFLMFAYVAYDLPPHIVVALCVIVARNGEQELVRLGPEPVESVQPQLSSGSFPRPLMAEA